MPLYLRPNILLGLFLIGTLTHIVVAASPPQDGSVGCDSPSRILDKNTILQCLRSKARCYSLPYGAVGFISHVLTYYCTVVIALGRKPLRPSRKQERHMFNSILGIVQLLTTVIPAVMAAWRCRNAWEFQRIAIWLAFVSIASATATTAESSRLQLKSGNTVTLAEDAVELRPSHTDAEEEEDDDGGSPRAKFENRELRRYRLRFWLLITLLWSIGFIVGWWGIFFIVADLWDISLVVRGLSIALFIPIIALPFIMVLLPCASGIESEFTKRFVYSILRYGGHITTFCLFVTLIYTDWVLAAALSSFRGSLLSSDSTGRKIYLGYVLFERLVLFVS